VGQVAVSQVSLGGAPVHRLLQELGDPATGADALVVDGQSGVHADRVGVDPVLVERGGEGGSGALDPVGTGGAPGRRPGQCGDRDGGEPAPLPNAAVHAANVWTPG